MADHSSLASADRVVTDPIASSSKSRTNKSKKGGGGGGVGGGEAANSSHSSRPSTANKDASQPVPKLVRVKSKDTVSSERGGFKDSAETASVASASTSKSSKRSRPRKDEQNKRQQNERVRTKVVVRRLPANVSENIFWNSVAPWVRDAAQANALREAHSNATTSQDHAYEPTVDYKDFIAGKLKADPNKENTHSRAYIRFIDPAMVIEFHKQYDGHVFRDSKGNESIAIVEFAPHQKIPAERKRKPDARQGTIDDDPDYKAFLQKLEDSKSNQAENKTDTELMAHLLQPDKDLVENKKSTPLLDHLRSIKAARAEAAALSAAKSYKNPFTYQYPDDKSSSSSKKKRSKSTKDPETKKAIKKTKTAAKRLKAKEEKKAAIATTAPSAVGSSGKETEKEKGKKPIKGIVLDGKNRAFGAAIASAIGGSAVSSSDKVKEKGGGGRGEREKKMEKVNSETARQVESILPTNKKPERQRKKRGNISKKESVAVISSEARGLTATNSITLSETTGIETPSLGNPSTSRSKRDKIPSKAVKTETIIQGSNTLQPVGGKVMILKREPTEPKQSQQSGSPSNSNKPTSTSVAVTAGNEPTTSTKSNNRRNRH